MTIEKLALIALSFQGYHMPEVENTTSTETLLDMDDIDNMSFNDVEDAPEFVNPPDGVYDLMLTSAKREKYKLKSDNPETGEKAGTEKRRIRYMYEILQVVELADPNEQAPKVADKFSEQWSYPGNGLKYWKGKTQAIMGEEVGDSATVANVVQSMNDAQHKFRARITSKVTKQTTGPNKGKDFRNINVKVIALAKEIPGFEDSTGAVAGAGQQGAGGVAVD